MAVIPVLHGQDPLFWNFKDPSKWTPVEIERILTDSPWARRVHAGMENEGRPRRLDDVKPGNSGRLAGNNGGVIVTRKYSTPSAGEPVAFYGEVTVRWETAPPILSISGLRMLGEFENRYILSVTGLPKQILATDPSGGVMLYLGTNLSVPGHPPLPPESVTLTTLNDNKGLLIFTFSPRKVKIGIADKTAVFNMRYNGVVLKAKFEPKEMLYRGQLTL